MLLTACTVLALAACSATQTSATTLKEAVEDYTLAMRWGHIERAAAHVADAKRKDWIQQRRMAQAQVQIHEYDIRAVEHVIGTDRARIMVLVAWSRPADPVVHQELLVQDWQRRNGLWTMAGQQPLQMPQGGTTAISPTDAL